MAPVNVTDVLDRTRPVAHTYPDDGSYDCPFCACAVIAPKSQCENPGCPASTYALAHPESCRQAFADRERRDAEHRAEVDRRTATHRWALEYIAAGNAERAEWTAAQYTEQARRGTCRRCLKPDAFRHQARFVKHRGPCPEKEQR